MKLTILISGGIGSGKSLACSHLRSLGIPVYDCDSAAKRLYREDRTLLESIVSHFGKDVLSGDGEIDMKALGAKAFATAQTLSSLEAIVHPAVLKDLNAWKLKNENSNSPCLVVESAIAKEKPLFDSSYDASILVDCPLEERIRRTMLRDSSSADAVLARIQRQHFDPSGFTATVNNDSSEETLFERIEKTIYYICKLKQQ